MLTLTRRKGEYVDLENLRTRGVVRVTLKHLHEGIAEIELSDPVKREVIRCETLKPHRDFDDGEVTITHLGVNSRTQMRMGFDAPNHIRITRDNIKNPEAKVRAAA